MKTSTKAILTIMISLPTILGIGGLMYGANFSLLILGWVICNVGTLLFITLGTKGENEV